MSKDKQTFTDPKTGEEMESTRLARWFGKLIFGLGCGLIGGAVTGALLCGQRLHQWVGTLWVELFWVCVLFWGVIGWMGYGLVERRGSSQGRGRFNWLRYGLGFGLFFGLFFGLLGVFVMGLTGGEVPLAMGWLLGLALAGLSGLIFGSLAGRLAPLNYRGRRVLGYGLYFGLVSGICILLVGVAVGFKGTPFGWGSLVGGGIAGLIGELTGRLVHPFTQRVHDAIARAQHSRR